MSRRGSTRSLATTASTEARSEVDSQGQTPRDITSVEDTTENTAGDTAGGTAGDPAGVEAAGDVPDETVAADVPTTPDWQSYKLILRQKKHDSVLLELHDTIMVKAPVAMKHPKTKVTKMVRFTVDNCPSEEPKFDTNMNGFTTDCGSTGYELSPRNSISQHSRFTFLGGVQALKDCEELTTWANEILKERKCRPITDLRKSVTDGIMLVNLLEILANDKVANVQNKPLSRSQKVENLQNCVEFLDRNGVQLNGLSTEDLADGNLKSTLMLMNNIRHHYDGGSRDRATSSHARLPPDPMDMPPPHAGGNYMKPQPPPRNSTDGGSYQHGVRKDGMTLGSTELLPGVLGKRDEDPRPIPLPPNIVRSAPQSPREIPPPLPPRVKYPSTTQLDYNGGVSQHGVEQRRSHLPPATSTSLSYSLGHGGGPPPPRPRSAKPSLAVVDIPPSSAQQAWTTANQVSNQKQSTASEVREAVSLTVEERLRSLLSSSASSGKPTPISGGSTFASSQGVRNSLPARGPGSHNQGVVNGGFTGYEDGELILPPPRRSHVNGGGEYGSQQSLRGNGHEDDDDLYNPAYVPSQPSERLSTVSRGQAILNRLQQHQQQQDPSVTSSSHYAPPRPPYPQEVSSMPGQYGGYAAPPGGDPHQQATSRAGGGGPPPPPSYQPPPQYGQRQAGNPHGGNVNPAYQLSPQLPPKSQPQGTSDLRNACSRIYGDNVPTSRPSTSSAGLSVYTNNQSGTPYSPPMWPKYGDSSVQPPRTSPMGQSASTPSQGSHSPSSPGLPNNHNNMHAYNTKNSDMDYTSKHDQHPRPHSNPSRPLEQPQRTMGNPPRPSSGNDFTSHANSEQQHHRAGSMDHLTSHLPRGSMERRSQGGNAQHPGSRSSSAEHPAYAHVDGSRKNMQNDPTTKSLDRRPSIPGNLDSRNPLAEEFSQVPPPLPQRNHPADHNRYGSVNGPSNGKSVDGPKSQINSNGNQSTVVPNGMYSQLQQQHIRERSRSNESRDWLHKGGDKDYPDTELKVLNSERPASRAAVPQSHPHQSHYNHNNKNDFHDDEYTDSYKLHNNLAHKMAQMKLSTSKWQSNAEINSRENYASSISSSRSVTPPLPPLSPSNTPPLTPPQSPRTQQRRLLGNDTVDFMQRTPDVVNSTSKKNSLGNGKRKTRRTANGGITVRTRDGRPRRNGTSTKYGGRSSVMKAYRQTRSTGSLDQLSDDSGDEEFTVEESVTAASGTEDLDSTLGDGREITVIRRQMEGLETMYVEILKMLGVDREFAPGSRNSISSQSTISRTGRSRMRRSHHPHHRREIRQVNKRFQRLESHVVTLARSVAHLSSEMRGQATVNTEMEEVKQDIKRLKEAINNRGTNRQAYLNEFERFRGWVPSLSNPRRVNKLTKFFGQEPPFLHIFLKKLGYERYIPNFDQEKISLIELPYMNEDRLQRIGIPMGPRLRILQEAQMCFRQENFDIYIV